MIDTISMNLDFKMKFNVLLLVIDPWYNFIKNSESAFINSDWNSEDSVSNIPAQCLKVNLFKLHIIIEGSIHMKSN